MTATVTITDHARGRFAQRFPGADANASLGRAVPVKKALVRKAQKRKYGTDPPPDTGATYFLWDRAIGAVWVVRPPWNRETGWAAVTVYQLDL